MKMLVLGLAAASVLGLAGAAHALTYNEFFILTGAQEVPPVNSNGFGAANVSLALNTATNTLTWDIISTNLSSSLTAATFNGPAPAGQTGPTTLDLSLFGPLDATMHGSTVVSDQAEQQITGGLWYLNLSTINNPSGEIRGQLPALAVPEPAVAGLLALGVGGLMLRLRRR